MVFMKYRHELFSRDERDCAVLFGFRRDEVRLPRHSFAQTEHRTLFLMTQKLPATFYSRVRYKHGAGLDHEDALGWGAAPEKCCSSGICASRFDPLKSLPKGGTQAFQPGTHGDALYIRCTKVQIGADFLSASMLFVVRT